MAARKPASPLSAADSFRITRLGADGDGAGEDRAGQPAWIAYTLPGETVTARRVGTRAVLTSVDIPSPQRVSPPCPHFGACGGCSLQHWRADAVATWKTSLLAQALARAGYDNPPIRPLVPTPAGVRQRIDLEFRRDAVGFHLGLHARLSHEVVDLSSCLVLDPRLVALLAPLRALLPRLRAVRAAGSAILNALDSGPDLLLRTDAAMTAGDRAKLADFARAESLCRITHAEGDGPPETVCLLRPPQLQLAGAEAGSEGSPEGNNVISPPPGGFLQASPQGAAAIVTAVLSALPPRLPAKARIAELYAGCGTLTFALATRARVTAWEGDAAAIAALRNAHAPRIEAIHRDLVRQPLQPADLARFAAIVLDPPWHGAGPLMPAIAGSGVPSVIYVSCNPVALGRDAAVLCRAGYEVTDVTPIDQFLWSARIESVVSFRRASRERR